jgi:F-type H+-transporting ATPase subunit O
MAHIPALLARSFSTSGVAQQMVKAPVQVFGVEGRYASALYSAASKQKQLDQVEKDLKDIHGTLKKKGQLNDLLLNPSINRNEKRDIVAKAMGSTKASKLTGNLLALLAENGKLSKLEAIAASYFTIMSAHCGELECEVTTAKPLDAPMQQELQTVLKSFVKSGQSIILKAKVDPSILGGMIVSIGDKYVDMSTASKIKKYTDLIQQAV